MSETQRLRYAELSPRGMGAMRGVEHYLNVESGLDAVLLEMVRLRASQLNGCGFCMGLHAHELRKHNEPESRVGAVARWRHSTEAFTKREQAALAWTEAVTTLAGAVPDEAFQATRVHFEDKELVDLTMAIASINAWNRLGVAFRLEWDETKAPGKDKAKRVEATSGSNDGDATLPKDEEGKASVNEE